MERFTDEKITTNVTHSKTTKLNAYLENDEEKQVFRLDSIFDGRREPMFTLTLPLPVYYDGDIINLVDVILKLVESQRDVNEEFYDKLKARILEVYGINLKDASHSIQVGKDGKLNDVLVVEGEE